MSTESKKKPSLRFKEKEKEVLYNVGVWYLYCTKTDDFYAFDKTGEHVIEYCGTSSGWFRTFCKGMELVHWVTGVTEPQKMEGKETVIDVLVKGINEGKEVNVIDETCRGSFGSLSVNIGIEKETISLKRKSEWEINVPIKWDGSSEISFKDMDIFKEIKISDVIDCMIRGEEIAQKRAEEEARKKKAEEEALREKYKSLIGGPPNEEACSAFSSGERERVYSFGIWFITITGDGGDGYWFVTDREQEHVLQISLSSNGWFRTSGPDSGHTHWSSGSTSEEEMRDRGALDFIHEHLEEGMANRLRPDLTIREGGWKFGIEEDGLHLRYRDEHKIFLNIGEASGRHGRREMEW